MIARTLLLLVTVADLAAATGLYGQDFLERQPKLPTFEPGQVIVKTRTGAPIVSERLGALGLDTAVRRLYVGEFLYRMPPSVVRTMAAPEARRRTLAVVDSLKQIPDVEYVHPDYRLYIVGDAPPAHRLVDVVPNDPRWSDQWHYHNNGTGAGESPGGINLPRAWNQGTGRAGIVVSILDTGILPSQEDIAASPNLIAGRDLISDPFIANDGGGRDADPTDPGDAVRAGECGGGEPPVDLGNSWHGTHVAGTVGIVRTNNALGVAGVNQVVSVQPVRVLGKCGGLMSDINDAIRWAAGLPVSGVPNNPTAARVINMSLGAFGLPRAAVPALQAAINDAVAAGVVVVVAAGNDAADASQVVPASCDNVITVAASDARGHLATRYSNFGRTVEIMAPGGDIRRDDNVNGKPDGVLSTVQGGYEFYNGTSMATPHVAGVAALWLAQDANLTAGQVLGQLQARALPRTTAHCPQPCGAGLLNADRGPAPRPVLRYTFSYAAKVVCGFQRDSTVLALVPGLYATAINIHNPGDSTVIFSKRLAITHPPGGQQPGRTVPIGLDTLRPGQALEVDCEDIRRRARLDLSRYVKGFVVLQSAGGLDVTAVYTAGSLATYQVTSIDVESVPGRRLATGDSQLPPPVTHATGTLQIPQTWLVDLDEGALVSTAEADIWFEAVTATQRYVTPRNGATIAIVGTTSVGRDGCMAASLTPSRIPIGSLPVGTYVCVRTTQGRYSQFRVNAPVGPSPGTLVIGYTTWEAIP